MKGITEFGDTHRTCHRNPDHCKDVLLRSLREVCALIISAHAIV